MAFVIEDCPDRGLPGLGEDADGLGDHLGVAGCLEQRVGVRLDGVPAIGLDDRLDSLLPRTLRGVPRAAGLRYRASGVGQLVAVVA